MKENVLYDEKNFVMTTSEGNEYGTSNIKIISKEVPSFSVYFFSL